MIGYDKTNQNFHGKLIHQNFWRNTFTKYWYCIRHYIYIYKYNILKLAIQKYEIYNTHVVFVRPRVPRTFHATCAAIPHAQCLLTLVEYCDFCRFATGGCKSRHKWTVMSKSSSRDIYIPLFENSFVPTSHIRTLWGINQLSTYLLIQYPSGPLNI